MSKKRYIRKRSNKRKMRAGAAAPSSTLNLSFWQINLLAAEFTKYNFKYHGGEPKSLETKKQTVERYTRSSKSILEHNPHFVCLQECSSNFFKTEFNDAAALLLSKYERFEANMSHDYPSTALLIHKSYSSKVRHVLKVGGTEKHGGKSKMGICALVELPDNKLVWVCSVHLSFEPNPNSGKGNKTKAKNLLNDLSKAIMEITPDLLTNPNINIFLSGDFNMGVHELNILNDTFLRNINFIEMPCPTGLTGNFEKVLTIDHVYSSLPVKKKIMGVEDLRPTIKNKDGIIVSGGPYILDRGDGIKRDRNSIQAPSDHIWIKVDF